MIPHSGTSSGHLTQRCTAINSPYEIWLRLPDRLPASLLRQTDQLELACILYVCSLPPSPLRTTPKSECQLSPVTAAGARQSFHIAILLSLFVNVVMTYIVFVLTHSLAPLYIVRQLDCCGLPDNQVTLLFPLFFISQSTISHDTEYQTNFSILNHT